MKFIYIDESGEPNQSDVFVLCGLMVDAYKLRKKTADFDIKLKELLVQHPGQETELKTKRFINGRGGWSKVSATERKIFLSEVCKLAVSNGGKVYGLAISQKEFKIACESADVSRHIRSYWLTAAIFTACLVQKKMQSIPSSKGLTVFIMDDNKQEMPDLSNALYRANPWFDGLYQVQVKRRNNSPQWKTVGDEDRLDQIINTAFAIKSNHSSLVQVADAIAYVYRRFLELQVEKEAWKGELEYFHDLVSILEPRREKLGKCPKTECLRFYNQIRHPDWKL